jgi:hypothetical protein
MKRWILGALAALLLLPCALAQTGYVTMTAANLTDQSGSGAPISNATACFQLTNAAGTPISVHIGGSGTGQAAQRSNCGPVNNGALVGTWQANDPTAAGTNLVPDPTMLSVGTTGTTWIIPSSGWGTSPGAGYGGTNAITVNSTVGTFSVARNTDAITVIPGQTYTLAGYIDARAFASGTVAYLAENIGLTAAYGAASQSAGVAGWVETQFVIPAGVTQIYILADTENGTGTSGVGSFSAPLLQAGSSRLVDTNLSNPQNPCNLLTITDNTSGNTVLGGPGSGYACIQPQYAMSSPMSCVAGVCNLDTYVPTGTPGALQTTGPTGPAGPTGPQGPPGTAAAAGTTGQAQYAGSGGNLAASAATLDSAGNFKSPATVTALAIAQYLGAADNTGVADASSYVNAAITAQLSSYLGSGQAVRLPPGQFYVPSLSNVYGVPFTGLGRLLKSVSQQSTNLSSATVTATQAQQNSYAYTAPRLVFGQEYLSHWLYNIENSVATTAMFSGDSTTSGTNVSSGYTVDQLFKTSATNAGISGLTVVNEGHSGMSTANWLSSYLSSDQSANPDVYFIRWSINDPINSITAAQTIANIRTGLACIRNGCSAGGGVGGSVSAKTVDQETIVLEMPSSTNDNPNGRGAEFYEQLRNGFAQAARDYQAVFIDLYGLMPDNDFTVQTCMMSSDYQSSPGPSTPEIHIHPGNCKAILYNDLLAKTLIDPLKVILGGGGSGSGNITATTTAGLRVTSNFAFSANSQAQGQISNAAAASAAALGIERADTSSSAATMLCTGTGTFCSTTDWQYGEFSGGMASSAWQLYDGSVSRFVVGIGQGLATGAFTISLNSSTELIKTIGAHPCFDFSDSGGTADNFVGSFVNVGEFSVNRNPCTGVFTATSKTAAAYLMNATAGGTQSYHQWFTSATANTSPTEEMRLTTGLSIGNFVVTADAGDGNLLLTHLVTGVVPSAIASASTIAPVSLVQHVTGTTAISTITVPTPMDANVGGCVTLIADGAWTTTTSGNIDDAITATAGTAYSACYDGSKWYVR